MDAVRYFRGLAPIRRQRVQRFVCACTLVALAVLTVLVAAHEIG